MEGMGDSRNSSGGSNELPKLAKKRKNLYIIF